MLHIKLAQFAVRCALPPRRSESPVCATDNKPSCVLHLLDWLSGSRGFSSLERRPEFWVLHYNSNKNHKGPSNICASWGNIGGRGWWGKGLPRVIMAKLLFLCLPWMFSIVSAFFSHLRLNLFLGTLGRPRRLWASLVAQMVKNLPTV